MYNFKAVSDTYLDPQTVGTIVIWAVLISIGVGCVFMVLMNALSDDIGGFIVFILALAIFAISGFFGYKIYQSQYQDYEGVFKVTDVQHANENDKNNLILTLADKQDNKQDIYINNHPGIKPDDNVKVVIAYPVKDGKPSLDKKITHGDLLVDTKIKSLKKESGDK